MASGSSRGGKKATLHDYMQPSSSSEKERSHSRVQSGPLRHSPASRSSRYSPVTGRKESKSVPVGGSATGSKGMQCCININ
jgi:hypothetical protein